MTPAAMARLHAAAFPRARPWSEAEFAALLAQPGCFAAGDERAFALVRVIADEAELLTIATHPDHRRRGLARALMAAWTGQAERLGARRAFLEVAADNAPAVALYEATGFTPCGRRRGYYRRAGAAPADALIYARDLP